MNIWPTQHLQQDLDCSESAYQRQREFKIIQGIDWPLVQRSQIDQQWTVHGKSQKTVGETSLVCYQLNTVHSAKLAVKNKMFSDKQYAV